MGEAQPRVLSLGQGQGQGMGMEQGKDGNGRDGNGRDGRDARDTDLTSVAGSVRRRYDGSGWDDYEYR